MNMLQSRLIKLVKYMAPPLLISLPLAPFINGIGCDFVFSHHGESTYRQGYCKNGELTIYFKNKEDGSIHIRKMQWGYLGENMYTYRLKNALQPPASNSSIFSALYDTQKLSAGLVMRAQEKPNYYYIYFQHPFEVISENKIKGKLGYY